MVVGEPGETTTKRDLSPPQVFRPAPGTDGTAAIADSEGAPVPSALVPEAVPVADAVEKAPAMAPAKLPRRRTRVRPVFVVCLARSGSTLLRYLLDSHPQIASPPELNLSALLQHVVEVWLRSNEALGTPLEPGQPLPPDVCRRARKVVDEVMLAFAAPQGRTVFCDKSLTTVDHLPIIAQCYPDASFVFLYRYPLDFIASGVEASRWGYNAYGFTPYMAGSVNNFVAGLGNYWIDRVSRMIQFEQGCTAAHARIYYELLCDDPEATLGDLMEFLDLERDEGLIRRAFESEHGRGPGDYKIDFTQSVSAKSVGRGSTIPQLLLPAQVAQIDELLARLDYPSLEAGWRGDLPSLLGLKSAKSAVSSHSIAEDFVAALARRGPVSIPPMQRRHLPISVVVRAGGDDAVVEIGPRGLATMASQPPTGRPAEDGGGDERLRVRCTGDILMRVLAGEVSVGQAVHDGQIRVEGPPSGTDQPRRIISALAAVLSPGASESGAGRGRGKGRPAAGARPRN